MKLKDIFNIDLSTRGGVKLYRKIMGKYNIPKQDSKQLVKEIRNSSEGGGVKEYYYKVLDLSIYNNSSINSYLKLTCSLSGAIIQGDNEYPSIQITRDMDFYGVIYDLWNALGEGGMPIIGFRFYDDVAFIPDYNISSPGAVKIEKGNLEERLIDIIRKSSSYEEEGREEWLQDELIPALRQSFKEITKEEYESMITYKPE